MKSFFVHVQLDFIGHQGATIEQYQELHNVLTVLGGTQTIFGEKPGPDYGTGYKLPHSMYRVFSDLSGSDLQNRVHRVATAIWPGAVSIVCDWDHCWFNLKQDPHAPNILAAAATALAPKGVAESLLSSRF